MVDRLAKDLRAEFPEMAGFSPRNLKYMRAFAAAYADSEFVQQVVAQPVGHNLPLLNKLKQSELRSGTQPRRSSMAESGRAIGPNANGPTQGQARR